MLPQAILNSDALYSVEQLLEPGGQRPNEDQLIRAGNRFGVFDGASSLVPDLYDGHTGAWWASHLAGDVFTENEGTLFELGKLANQNLRRTMIRRGVDMADRLQCWSTSGAVVAVQEESLEWWQIGDCQILAIDRDGRGRLLAPYHNHDLETLRLLKNLREQGLPDVRERLQTCIEKVRRQMNLSYGVLNGDSAALDFFFGREVCRWLISPMS